MDTKKTTTTITTKPKSRRRGKSQYGSAWIHKGPNDSIVLTSAWSWGNLTSGTAGTLATTISCSFATHASEYSAVSSLFGESRLLRAVMVLTPVNPQTDVSRISGNIQVGWNPNMNETKYTTPASFAGVINLAGWKAISTAQLTPTEVPANVKHHDYDIITSADPLVGRGDCGVWVVYGTGLTNSLTYFQVYIHAQFAFRGRL